MFTWLFILIALGLIWKQRSELRELRQKLQTIYTHLNLDSTSSPVAMPRATKPAKEPYLYRPKSPPVSEKPQAPVFTPAPEVAARQSSKWNEIEKKLVENWTGILGAVAMVAGVGFLSVYAALQLEPVYRFVLILIFSSALAVGFFTLRRNANWNQFGHWLGSAGAAIFLLGCVGSGGIPGLQWITNPWFALALLSIGIVANLGFAFIGGGSTFASLHTILSMIALALSPNDVTLITAMFVSLAAISFSYRYRWDLHLLLTLTSFFVFVIFWRFFPSEPHELSMNSRFIGYGAIAAVALAAGLVHYRKDYQSKLFEAFPLATHLANWLFAGIGFAFLAINSKWKTIPLMAAAIAAFALARRAKRLNIRWLYRTDTLVSQLIFLVALISLSPWGTIPFAIAVLVFIQTLAFALLMRLESDDLLSKLSEGFIAFAFMSLIYLSTIDATVVNAGPPVDRTWASLFALLVGFIAHCFSVRKFSADKERPIESTAIGFLPLILYLNAMHFSVWAETYAMGGVILFLASRTILKSNFFGVGSVGALASIILIGWGRALWVSHFADPTHSPDQIQIVLFSLSGFLALILSIHQSRWFGSEKTYPQLGVYLLGVHLGAAIYFLTEPVSSLLPGVVWVLTAPVLLELARFVLNANSSVEWNRKTSESLLQISYFFILAFITRHIFYHLQVEDYWEIFKIRMLIEVLGVAVIAYFLFSPESDRPTLTEQRVQPYFLEIFILSLVAVVVEEVPALWNPLIWSAAAIVMFRLGSLSSEKFNRLRFYSLLMAWAGAIHVAAITSTIESPDLRWYFQPWFVGSVTLFFSVMYLTLVRASPFLAEDRFPIGSGFLAHLSRGLAPRKHLWIYYPFFIAMGIFVFWRFERAILTLVFVILSFVIFTISILHRVSHFRILALSIVAICMIRLVVFDLAQSGTLTRGVVFLGVGGIMLLMNVIYRRFNQEAQ